MTTARLAALLENLPLGFWEIYLHPATCDDFPGSAVGYRHRDELAALTDARAIEKLRRTRLPIGGYQDIWARTRA